MQQINFDEIAYYDYSDSLIIIDEISLHADNRDFKTFSKELLEFFKLAWSLSHRYYMDKSINSMRIKK